MHGNKIYLLHSIKGTVFVD